MCKKLGVTALVIVAALFVLHKLDLDSYLKLAWKNTKRDITEAIPPEVKLQRLEDEISKLAPEERKARALIAQQMTDVAKMKTQIADSRANLDKREAQLEELRAEVKKGSPFVSIGTEKLPREKVEASLARKWQSFKEAKEALTAQEDLLKSREEGLEVAKAKLDTMQEKRKQMQAKVATMKVDLEKLRLAQTQHDVAIDDSQLSTVMKLYDEVNSQIETQKTALSLEKGADTDQAVEQALAKKEKTDKALKELDEHFSNSKLSKKD